MDFTKFLAMLVNKGLYLSRLDHLGDAYEGWVPELSKEHYRGFFAQERMDRDRELKKKGPEFRKQFFVNCWHANDEQSDAMWKLYAKGTEGIAIQTTCRNLRSSLTDDLWLYEVMYASPEQKPTHGGSMLRACLTKRVPFRHEHEVRLVWCNSDPPKCSRTKSELDHGFYVACDLATLIEKLYVAPTEKPWFQPIVENVLRTYGITAKVEQSGLKLTPP